MQSIPLMYNFRRCPYAMRARLGLTTANMTVELREIILRNKPQQMLEISPKGTVPVLQLPSGKVIDESLDIAKWALSQNDPLNLLPQTADQIKKTNALIAQNDGPFKHHLDRTKYQTRYQDEDPLQHRNKASTILKELDQQLNQHTYLLGQNLGFADLMIAPFIRQFANIDRTWFENQPWPNLITWLDTFQTSNLFAVVMKKYPLWNETEPPQFFPPNNRSKHPFQPKS